MNSFIGTNKEVCKLYVPIGSYNTYRNHGVWGQFVNIIETDFSLISEKEIEKVNIFSITGGISIISEGSVEIEIFNLVGQKVFKSKFVGSKEIPLEKGVYIVSINNEKSKIIIK